MHISSIHNHFLRLSGMLTCMSPLQIMQKAMLAAVAASTFVNVGAVLSANAIVVASRLSFAGALASGFSMLVSLLKVKNLERKEKQLSGSS